MRRRLLLVAILGIIAVATVLPTSGASFTSSSASNVRVGTDSVGSWLHLYSQSTDPAGLTGYWPGQGRPPPPPWALTPLSVWTWASTLPAVARYSARAYSPFKPPSSFPTGTTITVTATLVSDPTTGTQPITALGIRTVGQNNTTPSSVTLGLGVKRQVNLRITLPVAKGVYRPKILITVTYTGMTTTYYQYTVPVQVTVGSQAGAAVSEGAAAPASDTASSDLTTLTTESTTVTTDGFDVPTVDPPAEDTDAFADPGSEWLPAPERAGVRPDGILGRVARSLPGRSRESSLSMEAQRRSRRSRTDPPSEAVGGWMVRSSANTAGEKSGSNPRSSIALRAIASRMARCVNVPV